MENVALEAAIARIKELSARKQYAQVVDLCDELEQQTPATYEIYYHRAQAKRALSDFNGALGDLSRAIQLEPREPALFFFRGLWSIDVGDHASAARDLEQAIELEEKLGSSYYRQSSKFARAVALLLHGELALMERECGDLPSDMNSFVAGRLWTVAELRERARRQRQP